MASPRDTLERTLHLETEQGYRNQAVMGGLDLFLETWQREARAVQDPAVDGVLRCLSGYGNMDGATREAALQKARQLLDETEPPPVPSVAEPTAEARSESSEPPTAEAAPSRRKPSIGLGAPVTELKGVGEVNAKRLERVGVHTIRDLLYHFPRRYDDYSRLTTIGKLEVDEEVTICGIVSRAKAARTRSGRPLFRVTLSDGTGSIDVTWFNQPHLARQIRPGREIVVSGTVDSYLGRPVFTSPEWEPLQRQLLHTGRLVPRYPLTDGLRMRWLRRLMRQTLDRWIPRITDPMPTSLLERRGLVGLGQALDQIHFPKDERSLYRAKQRLCFDEFLLLQLGLLLRRRERLQKTGRALELPEGLLDSFQERLGFDLTTAQQRAIDEIVADLALERPMARLLQGDVGSGKTVVAAAAALVAVRNGLQVAVMAPTSILAEQLHDTLSAMLAPWADIRCELLIGGLPDEAKDVIRQDVASGAAQVVVGTHALIQAQVSFARLGLVVVDEQHRFGVAQRDALKAKGTYFEPHMLAMSATPIPRSLALTIYGDLDVSVLDEVPPNRQKVITAVRDNLARERIYVFIDGQIQAGHQVFVVCPLIEGDDDMDVTAAIEEHRRLQEEIFSRWRVGLLHGRMSAQDKEQIMTAFRDGAYDILVTTPVIEVGVDVPNATVMLIEDADRFGLAQLHQLRGRVGRGAAKSYCILMSNDPTETGRERLRLVEGTHDGFVLAEKDLEMRGPGDFLGVRQHGLPDLKVASLGDHETLQMAREEATALFEADPSLSAEEHQLLAASIRHFWRHTRREQ
ncbi:MAG: ATP-dependent DNA helicase RecG [Anaerolineae bacterium]|jgi:ATP-dependent DNA helicase RecG